MKQIFSLIIISVMFTLPGCGKLQLLPKHEGYSTIYILDPIAEHTLSDEPVTYTNLIIERPFASPGLDTERIALVKDNNVFDYYASVRWAEKLPNMVQSLLIESMENSGAIQPVAHQFSHVKPEHTLEVEIRDFQAEYNGSGDPTVHIKLRYTLLSYPERELIAQFTSENTNVASGNNLNSVIESFDQAFSAVQQDFIQTLKTSGKL